MNTVVQPMEDVKRIDFHQKISPSPDSRFSFFPSKKTTRALLIQMELLIKLTFKRFLFHFLHGCEKLQLERNL